MELKPCPNCKFGFGWDWEPSYGWVGCADCNDDGNKLKPAFRDWLEQIVFYSTLDAMIQMKESLQ